MGRIQYCFCQEEKSRIGLQAGEFKVTIIIAACLQITDFDSVDEKYKFKNIYIKWVLMILNSMWFLQPE